MRQWQWLRHLTRCGQSRDVPALVKKDVLTPHILVGVPLAVPLYALPYLENNHSPAECHRKPATATRESPDLLPEFELCDLFSESFVPEYDFIRRVPRVSTATDEE